MVNLSNISLFSTITPAVNLSFVNSCQLFDCHTRSVLNMFGNIITVSTVTPEIDFETVDSMLYPFIGCLPKQLHNQQFLKFGMRVYILNGHVKVCYTENTVLLDFRRSSLIRMTFIFRSDDVYLSFGWRLSFFWQRLCFVLTTFIFRSDDVYLFFWQRLSFFLTTFIFCSER